MILHKSVYVYNVLVARQAVRVRQTQSETDAVSMATHYLPYEQSPLGAGASCIVMTELILASSSSVASAATNYCTYL
jgi:hypothetical protein